MSHRTELSEREFQIPTSVTLEALAEKLDHIHQQMRTLSRLLETESQVDMLN